MAENRKRQQANAAFRGDVIKHLFESAGLSKHVRASAEEFVGSITADTKHEALAYHLFCTALSYISARVDFGDEHERVLTRVIERIRREWKSDTLPDQEHTLKAHGSREATGEEGPEDLKSKYPLGYRLMTKQGWSGQKGLGPNEAGISQPITVDTQKSAAWSRRNSGLGYKETTVNSTVADDQDDTERELKESAAAWNVYANDPCAGDQTAKQAYEWTSSTGKVPRLTRGLDYFVPSDARMEVIATSGQCVLVDEWKRPSTRTSTTRTPRTQMSRLTVPTGMTYGFAPSSGVKSEGW